MLICPRLTFLEAIARTIAALFLVAGHFTASHFIAARLVPARAPLLRWTATFTTGAYLATLAFHVLATTGLFHLAGALAAESLLLVALFAPRWARDLARADLAYERRVLRRLLARALRSPRRAHLAIFVALAVTTVVRPFIIPPLAWDTLSLHAFKAGLWVHHHGLEFLVGPSTWDLIRFQPAAAEVFNAWGMLVYHDDFLAMAPEGMLWLGTILAAFALARELGLREPLSSLVAAAFVTLPPLRVLVGSGYVEPALCFTLVSGLAFTVRALRTGEAGALVLAAAALGITCGMKITVLPVVGVTGVALIVRTLRARRRGLLAALVVFAAVALPWYVYSTVGSGLPFTPFPLKLFGVQLGHEPASAGIEGAIQLAEAYQWKAEWAALKRTFAAPSVQPEALGIASALPLVVFLLSWPVVIFRRRAPGRVLLFLVGLAGLAVIYSRSASPLRLYFCETGSRFWMPAFAAAVPLSALWIPRFPKLGRLYAALLQLMVLYHLLRAINVGWSSYDDRTLLAIGALAVVLTWLSRFVPRAAIAAACILLIAWFHGHRERARYDIMLTSTAIHQRPLEWLPMAQAVDHPDRPHRVAITGGAMSWGEAWFSYGFLGTRLQNTLFHVPVTRDGHFIEDLNQLSKLGHRDTWLERLRRMRAEYVVALYANQLETKWMQQLPAIFEPVYQKDGRSVFRVK